MLYAYGIICFLEGLLMALGISRGRIFNVIALELAFIAICMQVYGVFGNLAGFGWLCAIGQGIALVSNLLIADQKNH